MKKVELKELREYNFSEQVRGIGTCGVSFDADGSFNGYIYASDGFGNAETYLSVEEFLDIYPELETLLVEVEFNEDQEIVSLRG